MITIGTKMKFSLLQISYWCSVASLYYFAIAYVRTKGISAAYIGIMGAAFMICSAAGQFFWGCGL